MRLTEFNKNSISGDSFESDLLKHHIYIQKLGGGLSREHVESLAALLERVSSFDFYYKDALSLSVRQLNEGFDVILKKLKAGVVEVLAYEAEFQPKLLGAYVNFKLSPISVEQVKSSVDLDFVNFSGVKSSLSSVFNKMSISASTLFINTIRDAKLVGATNQEIKNNLKGFAELSKRHLDTVVRTSVNAASSVASSAIFEENSDVLEGYRFLATLDRRTSLRCASLDGQVFKIGEGATPPLHFNCRSTKVPIIKKKYRTAIDESSRPSVGSDGAKTVSSKMTYEDFLKKQSVGFQDSVLGERRAELFRSGKLDLKSMVNRFGDSITLEELNKITRS